ncbi:hypothetical protein ACHHYP_16236, partial [Achlya hypogyna]
MSNGPVAAAVAHLANLPMRATCVTPAVSAPMNVDTLHAAFESIHNDIAQHFEASPEPEPIVVATGVPVALYNEYYSKHDEDAPVAMRFTDLVDGAILITHYPSKLHEVVSRAFDKLLDRSSGVFGSMTSKGSMTAKRAGARNKEADETYGPSKRTPNRGPLPTGLSSVGDWITLVLEVGYSQSWRSHRAAAAWWAMYPGVRYIVLLRINQNATNLAFEIYHIDAVGPLPAPSQVGRCRLGATQACVVSFDTRAIL